MAEPDFPEELNYATSVEANIAILRAMADIMFMRKMEALLPLVAKRLVEAGVDFSKATFDTSPRSRPDA